LNVKQPDLLEGYLRGGEWCQFLLFGKIKSKYLKNTISNWTINQNSSSKLKVQFHETNKTQKLDETLTKGIVLKDKYQDPITIEDASGNFIINTRLLYNFSHVFLIYNPTNDSKPELFSITYQNAKWL
jgi:hypothetical protein